MRAYNFGAGPAMLPEAVMEQVQAEWLDWHASKMSIVEIGHRTQPFMDLLEQAEQDLRDLLQLPAHYRMLFLSGPTRMQFAAVALNLMGKQARAYYFDTGVWSGVAMKEAQRYGEAICVTSAQSNQYTSIPAATTWNLDSDTAYVHYTDNETVNGLQFAEIPVVGNVPLVTDMTSSFLSKPVDIERFGIIYAGAQKNVAPAGLTIVIIREDLLHQALTITPTTLHYQLLCEHRSLYYTPNTFACYVAGLTFHWLKQMGGLKQMEVLNRRKSQKLYQFIDSSAGFYMNPIDNVYRSMMNVVFRLHEPQLEPVFLEQAKAHNLLQLQGHKLVGGLRASLYNAMPEEGVDALINFMRDFQQRYG